MSGSVFERNGRWYFRIPAKTPDGRYTQIWKSDPNWSRSDAEKAKSKAEVERDGRGNVAPSKLTLAGWVELWLADRKITMKNSSGYRDYAMMLRDYVVYQGKDPKTGKHVKPTAISKVKLKDLRRKHFNDLYRGLESRGIHRTALKVHNVMRMCLKDAVLLEYLDRNPTDGLAAPKVETKEPEMPEVEGLKRLLALGDGTMIGDIVQLVIWTGLRESEVVAVKWADLDLGRRLIRIKEAKLNSIGTLSLSPGTVQMLVRRRLAQKSEAEALGKAWRDNDLVFCNEIGEPITTHGVRGRWGRLRAKAGIDLPFHGLRHVHASLLILSGMHPKMIQARMRHRDFSTTMNVYGHLMSDAEASDPVLSELDLLLLRD